MIGGSYMLLRRFHDRAQTWTPRHGRLDRARRKAIGPRLRVAATGSLRRKKTAWTYRKTANLRAVPLLPAPIKVDGPVRCLPPTGSLARAALPISHPHMTLRAPNNGWPKPMHSNRADSGH